MYKCCVMVLIPKIPKIPKYLYMVSHWDYVTNYFGTETCQPKDVAQKLKAVIGMVCFH